MTAKSKFSTRDFARGEPLFGETGDGDLTVIIISGSIEVRQKDAGKDQTLGRMSSGDIIIGTTRPADAPHFATALEASRVIMIEDHTLRQTLLNDTLPILKPLTCQLVRRLKEAEQQARYYRNKFKQVEKEITFLKGDT